jgi:heavy metal translocating P-type ATPase
MTIPSCSLCSNKVSNPIINDIHFFCCSGCQIVFTLLASKNALNDYKSHPLFLQAVRSGLISNPLLLEEISKKQKEGEETLRLTLEIEEMWCPACADLIRLILMNEKGVTKCVVDYSTDLAVIDFQPRVLSKEKILQLIRSCGYKPQSLEAPEEKKASKSLTLRFILSAFFAFNVMMFSYPVYVGYFDNDVEGYGMLFAWLGLFATIPVVTYCAWPIYRRFFLTLKWGLMGMETLVTLGVVSSFLLSLYGMYLDNQHIYFDTLSVIVTLVLLGKIIETKAKFSAKDSLIWLTRSLPKRARKRHPDGSQSFVKIDEFLMGDLMIISAGEKISLDGIVVEGTGACNESIMTGEAIPVNKKLQDKVISGSILISGWLIVQVTGTHTNSALQKLTFMVEQEITHKVHYERLADIVARWFVPLLLVLSISVGVILFLMTNSLELSVVRSISVLLIACPCAIGIAVPLAESHVINALARLGAIVKNRGCLKVLGKESVYVFDKTGTATLGRFVVLAGLEQLTAQQKRIIKGISQLSIHPISVALKDSISEDPLLPDHFENITGKGLKAVVGETTYLLGSERLLKENGWPYKNCDETNDISTQVYFGDGKEVYVLLLGDLLRPGIVELVKGLSTKTMLVSGDSEKVVKNVAESTGIKEFYSQMSPLQKRDLIDGLRDKGEIICMVGDGINDAPALAGAQIGISMVSASDVSIHASDLLLTTENIGVIGKIREVALRGQRIARQNLFWAFAYNVVGIPLAVLGYLTPLFAAFAMMASSLFVMFNSQRRL